MKTQPEPNVEAFRIRGGPLASDESYGNNGAFRILGPGSVLLLAIVSDGVGWEHVSVRPLKKNRTPTWEEMCFVKDLFWYGEEVVIQYHPAESQYVNNHPHVLHMWRPTDGKIPTPPSILVGIKNKRRVR